VADVPSEPSLDSTPHYTNLIKKILVTKLNIKNNTLTFFSVTQYALTLNTLEVATHEWNKV
jgi:hypothetical protein